MLELRPIKTEQDYQAALKEIETLFAAVPNTPAGDRLEILVTLVEAYEIQHYPITAPDPIKAILYYMESHGLSAQDLETYIGSQSGVAEILSRKQSLTLDMIRRLHSELNISAEVLIQPYALAAS